MSGPEPKKLVRDRHAAVNRAQQELCAPDFACWVDDKGDRIRAYERDMEDHCLKVHNVNFVKIRGVYWLVPASKRV